MTKRLIAASLAAAFSFGTAFGLGVSHIASKRPSDDALHQKTGEEHTLRSPKNALACGETPSGQTLCWPKDSAPPEGSNTICVEQDDKTLCTTESPQTKPGLDM